MGDYRRVKIDKLQDRYSRVNVILEVREIRTCKTDILGLGKKNFSEYESGFNQQLFNVANITRVKNG